MDYFEKFLETIKKNVNIQVTKEKVKRNSDTQDISREKFPLTVPDKIWQLYECYAQFQVCWESIDGSGDNGWADFVPYSRLEREHQDLSSYEPTEIDGKEQVIEDLKAWYPIFTFCNGDAFCWDKRSGAIVFFDHEVWDEGELHGLKIATSYEELLEKWGRLLFLDIYDWSLGVDEQGIDLGKEIYQNVLNGVKM